MDGRADDDNALHVNRSCMRTSAGSTFGPLPRAAMVMFETARHERAE